MISEPPGPNAHAWLWYADDRKWSCHECACPDTSREGPDDPPLSAPCGGIRKAEYPWGRTDVDGAGADEVVMAGPLSVSLARLGSASLELSVMRHLAEPPIERGRPWDAVVRVKLHITQDMPGVVWSDLRVSPLTPCPRPPAEPKHAERRSWGWDLFVGKHANGLPRLEGLWLACVDFFHFERSGDEAAWFSVAGPGFPSGAMRVSLYVDPETVSAVTGFYEFD